MSDQARRACLAGLDPSVAAVVAAGFDHLDQLDRSRGRPGRVGSVVIRAMHYWSRTTGKRSSGRRGPEGTHGVAAG